MEKKLFNDLVASLTEAAAIRKGRAKPARVTRVGAPHVRDVRLLTGLTQAQFAQLIGVSPKTLQNWEQDRRTPTGPASALIKIVAAAPKVAIKALHS
jgi:putative transcriptional regulator